MAAVIRSGRARGREVMWRQSFAVSGHGERGGGERRGRGERGMAVDEAERRQNNYQPVC